MVAERDVRVPVGADAARWVTVAAQRTVLAVARTVTSTVRVLDALALFGGDPRVQVVFTVNDSSPFDEGVGRLLADVGARVVPWRQVPRLRFDAVLTASENTELDGIDAPVLVLPHGVGFHKHLPDSRGTGRRLSGSLRPRDLSGGRVLVAVSHPEQAAQLAAQCPDLAGRTVVVADPVMDRLRDSRMLRERYRQRLGTGDRRLVVLSSTWGRESLLGRWPDLPARLLGCLPADEYQVLAVAHPNVWAGHGAWQVRSWWAHALAAGLLVVPPQGGWQAGLVAADCVLGDHGSVSLYAAGLDRALLLAPFGSEVVAGTAMARLGDLAPVLDPGGELLAQVAAAVAGHRPGRYDEPVARSFAVPPVARPLRAVLYELVGLAQPVRPAPSPGWPDPYPQGEPATGYAVYTSTLGKEVQVRRIPAPVDIGPDATDAGWSRHLSVQEDERDLRLLESASVHVRTDVDAVDGASGWAAATLDRFPGARLAAAATGTGCLALLRDGRRVLVSAPAGTRNPMLLAACVYAQLRASGDGAAGDRGSSGHAGTLADTDLLLRVGGVGTPVALRVPAQRHGIVHTGQ